MRTTQSLVALLASGIVATTAAFEINPIHRTQAHEGGARDAITHPVHERITRQAREQFAQRCLAEGGVDCKRGIGERTIQDSLLRGVWWSDDPNQNLYKGRQVAWVAELKHAGRHASEIDYQYKMMYRSHYGDMQFLHSMASTQAEPGGRTRDRVYMWGHFLYRVATGELKRDTKFRDVADPDLADYFKRHQHWELQWILEPRYWLRDNPHDFEDHALGALLHMLQDSYSASHVERDFAATAACPVGRVVSFHSYTMQDSDLHGVADKFAALDGRQYPAGGGPVDVSAQMMWFANKRANWETEVLPWLEKNVYCFDGEPRPADGGEFAKR